MIAGEIRRRRVGVLELIAYTVASEWTAMAAVPTLKRQFYAVMPQVVAAWARELGHRVSYATYYGQADPFALLPDDLDIVFIAASTQASALAYALARLWRARGVRTVIGGAHARCFPQDAQRFFDIVVTQCDRTLLAEIIDGRIDAPAIVASAAPPRDYPSVLARLPELAVASFGAGARPARSSIVAVYASTGCPYACGFCSDWNTAYAPRATAALRADLRTIATAFPRTLIGFHDPNFGIRLDDVLDLLDEIPPERRSRYLMQCALSVLTPARMERLRATRCLYVAPGVESWTECGNKLRLTGTEGEARLEALVAQFARLRRCVPGIQANFVMGLDSDAGDLPFRLTRAFAERLPFVWPNINILTPYGGTPVHAMLAREGRLLPRMPLALYCSPYLCFVPRHDDARAFYERLVALLEATVSPDMSLRRALLRDHWAIKLSRFAQTRAVRRDIREMRVIRDALRTDADLRAFHAGREMALPPLYRAHLARRLGRYAGVVGVDELCPPAGEAQSAAGSPAAVAPAAL